MFRQISSMDWQDTGKFSWIRSMLFSLYSSTSAIPYYAYMNAVVYITTVTLFAITAAGIVPCGGPKKSSRTSSIVQIIFLF